MANGHVCTLSALLPSNPGARVTLNCANMAVNVHGSKEADLLERAQCPLSDKWAAVADFYFIPMEQTVQVGGNVNFSSVKAHRPSETCFFF